MDNVRLRPNDRRVVLMPDGSRLVTMYWDPVRDSYICVPEETTFTTLEGQRFHALDRLGYVKRVGA